MSNDNRTGRPDGLHISGYHTLLSIAAYYAQITNTDRIAVGLIKEQTESLPTILPALAAFVQHVELLNPGAGTFEILAPLSAMSKTEVVQLGASLGVPFEATWSCWTNHDKHCGTCSQCMRRKAAFSAAGVPDPTDYEVP